MFHVVMTCETTTKDKIYDLRQENFSNHTSLYFDYVKLVNSFMESVIISIPIPENVSK